MKIKTNNKMPPSEGPGKELDEKCEELIVKYVSDIRNG